MFPPAPSQSIAGGQSFKHWRLAIAQLRRPISRLGSKATMAMPTKYILRRTLSFLLLCSACSGSPQPVSREAAEISAQHLMPVGAKDPMMMPQWRQNEFMPRRRIDGNIDQDDLGDDDSDPDGDEEDDMVPEGDGSGGEDDQASRSGSSLSLVLLPTILLGLVFTMCVVWRYCRKSNDDIILNQVHEYLSSFDDDDTSAIELRSDVYSDEDASRARSSSGGSFPRESSLPRRERLTTEDGEIA